MKGENNMNNLNIKEFLRKLSEDERKKIFPMFSDTEFEQLMQMSEQQILSVVEKSPFVGTQPHAEKSKKWFEKPLTGLSKEGTKHLEELMEQLKSPTSHHVDRKQVRYLQQLKKMRLSIPKEFRKEIKPKELHRHLVEFCRINDIPEEIVQRVVPALITYIETGHMQRSIIFVGEKGCGKTTAVKLLVEEALKIPTEVIKIPQTDGGHGMTGDCATYMAADAGCIAKARIKHNSLNVAYVLDEIDKVTHGHNNRANVDDELLSITDESCSDVYDNYLETSLVGLEHCPIFMTANDLEKINPILADRCTIIRFPNADATRIKSISRKYVGKKLNSSLYGLIQFDFDLMDKHIDNLVNRNVASLRKHQQMIEAVIDNAMNIAFSQESDEVVSVTEDMFNNAEKFILGAVKRELGFSA